MNRLMAIKVIHLFLLRISICIMDTSMARQEALTTKAAEADIFEPS